MNMIHQTVIILMIVVGFFANAAWADNNNVLYSTHIQEILANKKVSDMLKQSDETTGSEHLPFIGVVRSKAQSRDGNIRYDLLFEGQPGAQATQCALIVKVNLTTKKVGKLTKEEIQDALLPCVNLW